MKILVTGSNGLLGQKLTSLMASEAGVTLVATGRGEDRYKGEGYTYRSMDITSKEDVEAVITEERPEAIIHCAAMTNVDECEQNREACWKMNVDSVGYIIAAAEKQGSFLLHLSTDFIFDGKKGPLDEMEQPDPVNYYGESKLEAERLVQKSQLKWAIARTVLVYGITKNMSRSNIILWVKNSLEKQQHIKVVDDQWRTPTLAEDLAMGCFLIVKNKAEGIFNISGEDFLSPYDMAMKTVEYFKLDGSYIQKADSTIFSQPAKRPPKTGFIINKAKQVLGYSPRSFEEGIAMVATQVDAVV